MFIYVLDYSVCRIAKIKVDKSYTNFDTVEELVEDTLSKYNFDIDNCEYMTTDEDLDLEEYG